jgi:acetolactate synthase-1/2/3 large subunit
MIMITGQKGILSAQQARFQMVNTVATMQPLTKMTCQIVSPLMIPTLVREAFHVAQEESPGPVHLELPEDIAAERIKKVPLIPPHPIEYPIANEQALNRAAEMIMLAKRPLVMLGAAASRPRATNALSDFILRSKLPYFTTQMGKGTVSGAADFYMGTAALSARDYVHEAIESADLIITIGHSTVEKPPFIMEGTTLKVIHVGYQSATVEQIYFPQAEVIGDMGPSLKLLADKIEGKIPHANALLSLREGILDNITSRSTEDRFTPQRLVHDIRQVMPHDGIVALDNGMYKIWFARNYRIQMANTLLLDNALATMGAGLPSAIMAALLYPNRRVMAVCGDGGFMMNSQELETAVRLKLNLVVLIIEDNAFGMIRWKQAVDHFPDFGMTFTNPDFIKYADAYGACGTRVETIERFQSILENAFTTGGVHLITFPIDYSENKRVLVDELQQRLPPT